MGVSTFVLTLIVLFSIILILSMYCERSRISAELRSLKYDYKQLNDSYESQYNRADRVLQHNKFLLKQVAKMDLLLKNKEHFESFISKDREIISLEGDYDKDSHLVMEYALPNKAILSMKVPNPNFKPLD